MKTAGEIIQHLNETGANVYEISKNLGLGETTLRSRLIKLGYQVNQAGIWKFTGDPDIEPCDEDVVSTKRKISQARQFNPTRSEKKPNVHQALMELNLTKEGVRTTILIQADSLQKLKEFSNKTRLRLSDLYTLALQEFLNKYD